MNRVMAIMSILLRLAHAQAPEDLKVVEFTNVTLHEDEYCEYKNSTFRNKVEVAAPVCKTITCLHSQGKVRISECAPLKPGCERDPEPMSFYPECCRTKCLQPKHSCVTPAGYYLLPHGFWFYIRRIPCFYAVCIDGIFAAGRCGMPPLWRWP
uniref:Single domain-containing protein n=1 Tax=Amblyomma maculatum TaxID=34609 RepID=G3MTU9_AMBMU